jgi:hypothetical protein
MSERRGFHRTDVDGSVQFSFQEPSSLKEAPLDNISFGGFCMCSREKIEVGRVFDFELTSLGVSYPLSGKGQIRHLYDAVDAGQGVYKIGVAFKGVDHDSLMYFINRVTAKHCERQRCAKNITPIDFIPY